MISVIIPIYNSISTIKECLDTVFNSDFKNFEVIVISDNSTDNSVKIAKEYKCKIIELPENNGPAFARNIGADNAKGDILFFVDSDVIIKKNALTHISEIFSNNEINVLQGVYSHTPFYKNIATQYQQSFYCYYTWQENKKYASTLASMCFAIRKKIFLETKGFNTKIKSATAEDEEFGYKLIDKGNKILISRELNAEHRVNYTVNKLIRRNFLMYFNTMKSFLRNKSISKKIDQTNYLNIVISLPILGLILLTLFINTFIANKITLISFIILNVIFILLHLKFIKFVSVSKGYFRGLKTILICYLDSFLMIFGVFCAYVSYFFGKKY